MQAQSHTEKLGNETTQVVTSQQLAVDPVEELRRRLGKLDPMQVKIWQQMTPVQRLDIAFQAYQFVLDMVRFTEQQRNPQLSSEELAWRIMRRMQGNPKLGRANHESSQRS